ncbi:MAG: aminoacyl-tRNA hydrolase, partial [Bacteroidia bacterium]
FKKGQQVNYVLGEWDAEEKEKLKERLEISSEIVKSFALAGLNNTMNTYNGK